MCLLKGGEHVKAFGGFGFRSVHHRPTTHARRAQGWWPTTPDSAVIAFTVVGRSSLVGVDDPVRQLKFALRLYPSPSTRRVFLDLELPARGSLRATILDVLGRNVARVADGLYEAGVQRLHWDAKGSDGRACTPGVYFCSVDYAGRVVTRKFILLGGRL